TGKVVTECEAAMHLASPDVAAVYPDLVAAATCRFQVRVRLSAAEQERASASVIGLTPVFDGREGRMMLRILQPVLPLPDEKDVEYIGGGFMSVSLEFLGYFLQIARLRPTEDVLDVGCGIGRMAYSLTHYLEPTARYEGFDIVDQLVQWDQQTITSCFPNFTFHKVEVYNPQYNPSGTLKADEFAFPYESNRFAFVFLTSVFTHMRAPEVRHYLDEIYRVLKPGGRCLYTCFLLNAESE